MSVLPCIPRERATRLFDGCQAALVWLAVLALAVPESDVRALAVSAIVAIALAAALVALCPPAPSGPMPPAPAAALQPASPTEDLPHVP